MLKSNDTSYVTPSELEEGWGVYWTNPYTEYIPDPKTIIFFLQVSPDGKWLFWEDDYGLNLMNITTKNIKIVERFTTGAEWLPNSKEIVYGNGINFPGQIIFHDIYNQLNDTLYCQINDSTYEFGSYFGYDGNRYFAYPNGIPAKDSVIYRVLTDSSRKLGFPVFEPYVKGYTFLPYPLFPPNTLDYFLEEYPPYDFEVKTGFDVIRNLDYNGRTKIRIESRDTSWSFSACNTLGSFQYAIKQIEIGPRGDVYLLLSFRSKKDLLDFCDPKYWDSTSIAARNASGWYRVDTNGQNLVQLVRSWTYGMGGISITADGNTLYYGML